MGKGFWKFWNFIDTLKICYYYISDTKQRNYYSTFYFNAQYLSISVPFLLEKLSKTNMLYVALIQPLRSISFYPNLIDQNLDLGILLGNSIIFIPLEQISSLQYLKMTT